MFGSLRSWLVRSLKGFPSIDDAIDSIREKDVEAKYRILTLAVKKHFNTISAEDILQEDERGQWFCEGRILTDGEKKLLMAEAVHFLNTRLWKVLEADIKYQANRKMFILGKGTDDLVAGKLWMYTFDCLRTRLKSMDKGSAIFNKKQ